MKTIILTIFALCVCQFGLAQQKIEKEFFAKGRHSIGINLYPVFAHLSNIDTLYPFNITYKLQVKNSDRAWRFGLLGQYDENRYEDKALSIEGDNPPYSFSNSTAKYLLVGGYAGHEWQITLSKRWRIGYGTDVCYTYAYEYLSRYYEYGTPVNYSEQHKNVFQTHEIFAKAFTEINFAITSYLLVNTGFCLHFSFRHYNISPELTLLYGSRWDTPQKPDAVKQNSFSFRMLPFQQINIIYIF